MRKHVSSPGMLVFGRWWQPCLVATAILGGETVALARDRSAIQPEDIRPVERPATRPGDTWRDVADALLFLPRQVATLVFTTTGAVGALIEDEQIVPRVHSYWHPSEGEISLFPTAFVETGSGFNVGGRAIARQRHMVSSVRGGYGGPHNLVAETKMQFGADIGVPVAITLEGFHDQRGRHFLGLGQSPGDDPRNEFIDRSAAQRAHYVETREHFIGSVGGRFFRDAELFLSSSLRWRRNRGAGSSQPTLDDVFLPGSVDGANATTRFVYSELTLRLDTRQARGRPNRGVLLEAYAGISQGVANTNVRFLRYGGRTAVFVPVVKPSNVLSPKIVLDGLQPFTSQHVPFTELPPQPDFRGFDNRRDNISVVGTLDYRWGIWRYAGARLFFDMATVAPDLGALPVRDLRYAGGFGLDLFSNVSPLGSAEFVASPEGFLFRLNFGVPSRFGDRQHQ